MAEPSKKRANGLFGVQFFWHLASAVDQVWNSGESSAVSEPFLPADAAEKYRDVRSILGHRFEQFPFFRCSIFPSLEASEQWNVLLAAWG